MASAQALNPSMIVCSIGTSARKSNSMPSSIRQVKRTPVRALVKKTEMFSGLCLSTMSVMSDKNVITGSTAMYPLSAGWRTASRLITPNNSAEVTILINKIISNNSH